MKMGRWPTRTVRGSNHPTCRHLAAGFVDMYRSRWAPMVRLARLLTGTDPAAEELVQDAFLRVRAQWDVIENPSAYLRAAVVNGCRNHERRRKHRASSDRLRSVWRHDDRFELRGALEALPCGNGQRWCCATTKTCRRPRSPSCSIARCRRSVLLHRAVQDLER